MGRMTLAPRRSNCDACIRGRLDAGPEWAGKYVVVLHHLGEDVDGVGSGQVGVGWRDEGGQGNRLVVAEYLL